MPEIAQLLDQARRSLLDLSSRNRLLNMPKAASAGRIVHVHDELSEELYRLLVREQKSLVFVPGVVSRSATPDHVTELEENERASGGIDAPSVGNQLFSVNGLEAADVPDGEIAKQGEIAPRHRDLRLQTRLTPEGLQKRLLSIYYDARTLLEEQGVNILYLALGQLEWYESESSELPRYAPLILIPVRIDRKNVGTRFSIAWDQEDLTENLSLAAKLKADFGMALPSFEFSDDFDPSTYLNEIERAVAAVPRFRVLRHDIALAFFSFAKFLMYRDLDASVWPESAKITAHAKVAGLLRDGFPGSQPPLPDDGDLDSLVPPEKRVHVVDCDGSQSLVVAEVERGTDLVVQGPPGTGKSQTITNLLASAVAAGKRVLFVAEKLAALEVVKRNLERIGLGQIALELHSHKAHKKTVLEELGRTLALGVSVQGQVSDRSEALIEHTSALNGHARGMHTQIGNSGLTPFLLIGFLAELGRRQVEFAGVAISDSENWTEARRAAAKTALRNLATRVRQVGPPAQHPFRGVGLEVALPNEAAEIGRRAFSSAEAIDGIASAAQKLAALLEQQPVTTFAEMGSLCQLGVVLGKVPDIDRRSLSSAVWISGIERMRELLQQGRRLSALRTMLNGVTHDEAFEHDWNVDKQAFLDHGQSMFRLLDSEYRLSMRRLRLACVGPVPPSFAERRELFERLDEGGRLTVSLGAAGDTGSAAFGSLWRGAASNWSLLEAQVAWIANYRGLRRATAPLDLAARLDQPKAIGAMAVKLASTLNERRTVVESLATDIHLDIANAFGVNAIDQVPLEALRNRLHEWSRRSEDLQRWINYRTASDATRDSPLSRIGEAIISGVLDEDAAGDAFDQAFLASLLRKAVEGYPDLARFEGRTHEDIIKRFQKLDREQMDYVRLAVIRQHLKSLPRNNIGIGALGLLHREINKRARHMPIRKLLANAGSVIQQAKPVFMMSPLSVAQFLAPGSVAFDLLVIDEASQVEPVDALGAIARCGQIVVVGDDKQLPPTRFFNRMTGNDADEPEDEEQELSPAKDVDSVLGLCRARGVPSKMLRWHYRSRHHSLIAVSNHLFYREGGGLFIVPSPENMASASGLKFHKVNGIYDRGKTRQNRIEAKAVAAAVLDFATQASGQTLGVVAFSEAQKQAILDELELARAARPDLEPFFASSSMEPFFVKNLENVQGDERDVIFISIGYGRDVSGFISMGFGPLTANGGERRLNVLISRSRWRCEVFSSITADDIDLERTRSQGAAALKLYLRYAETGDLDIAGRTDRDLDSPFEGAVKAKLEEAGHTVHAQVGMAGFYIDLAVVDPTEPGRYVLGIECDGAAYHSSRSARDRDRLRQTVLEDHGWRIHRIWSSDWLHRPTEMLRALLAAVNQAIAQAGDSADVAGSAQRHTTTPVNIVVTEESFDEQDRDNESQPTVPYVEASFIVPRSTPIHELAISRLEEIVHKIVEVEQPIHEDEIVQRVRTLWNVGRAGGRIQEAVSRAIAISERSRRIRREDGAFLVIDPGSSRVRDRTAARSRSLRQPERLPPSELRCAVLRLVELSHRIAFDDIPTPVARWLGFAQTGASIRDRIESTISELIQVGKLVRDVEALRRPT